jgi:hypothetical protein
MIAWSRHRPWGVARPRPLVHLFACAIAFTLVVFGCGGSAVPRRPIAPPPPPRKELPPLAPGEIQRNVSGAVRLSRQCAERKALGGLYIIRLMIEPDGSVSSAVPRSGPTRASDPGRYSGVPRYLDAGLQPQNAVTRCFAAALRKLRFRPFGGPTVGFDHPVVVDPLPPSQAHSKTRACDSDGDCGFRPENPCACPTCGEHWRSAINSKALAKLRKRRRRRSKRARRRRAKRCRKLRKSCKPCKKPRIVRGTRALCIRSQCSVR